MKHADRNAYSKKRRHAIGKAGIIGMHPLHLNRQSGQAGNRSTADMHKDHPTVWSDEQTGRYACRHKAVIQTVRYTHRQAGRPTA